jgi:hypothetical protein
MVVVVVVVVMMMTGEKERAKDSAEHEIAENCTIEYYDKLRLP